MNPSWFITSKWGRLLLGAGILTVAIGLTYWLVDHRAYDRGIADCQAEHAEAVAKANAEQAKREGEQRAAATKIGKDSDVAAARITSTVDATTATTKEVIHDVYHEVLVPVAGSCTPRPLDPRVQDRIDSAVDSANGS